MANHEAEQYKARNCHCDFFTNGRTEEYVNDFHLVAFLGYRILNAEINRFWLHTDDFRLEIILVPLKVNALCSGYSPLIKEISP